MHIAPLEAILLSSGAAFFKTPERSASAQHSGNLSGRNGGAGLFQGLTVSVKEKKGGMKKLTDLPHEIVRYTASCLDVRSIAALAQTCRYLKNAVHDMAVEKMACRYYGPPGSQSRRQYETLYTPLAERLYPLTEPDNRTAVPLSEEQQARQRLHQITRLRSLSQNGKLCATCETLEKDGFGDFLTHGSSRPWGPCALLKEQVRSGNRPDREHLYIVVMSSPLSLVEVLAIKELSYRVDSAQILLDGQIVTAGMTLPTAHTTSHFFLALCQHDGQGGAVQQVVLPGTHSDKITCFKQLPDGRVVSASYDNTLKIRPLEPLDESLVITLTGHQGSITDMLLFAANRCITSSIDHTLKIWDLSEPSKEHCLTTLTDIPRIICNLQRLNEDHFLSESDPNITLIWRLTDSSAVYTALLDPDWPTRLRQNGSRTAPAPLYELPADPSPPPQRRPLSTLVLPGDRISVRHWSAMRLCDTTALHSEPKRLCILARNSSGAVSRSLPICPIGPSLNPLEDTYNNSFHLLPDGRLVHGDSDGTLHCYGFEQQSGTDPTTLGNWFSSLPQQYKSTYLSFNWITVMDDGRLFVCTHMNEQKTTLLVVYDPYALPKSPDNPNQESSRDVHQPP